MKSGYSKISRKDFLSQIGWLISLPLFLIGGLSIRRQSQLINKKEIRIPLNINDGVSFTESIIIIKNKKDIRFFDSSCPHLGCKINKTENELLVCPCHGSRFKLDGTNQKGPATQSLKSLAFKFDDTNENYIVRNS